MKVYIETDSVSSFANPQPATGTQPYSRIEQTALRMKQQYFKMLPDYPILRTKNGRPYFAHSTSLFFSGSHSKNFLITAMAEINLAVDIEQCRPKHFHHIAAHAFTEYEQKQLVQSKKLERDFFLLWTIKEAHIKLQGASVFDIKNAVRIDLEKRSAYCGAADETPSSAKRMMPNSLPYKHTICSFHLTKQTAHTSEHFIVSIIIAGQHTDFSFKWHNSTVPDECITIEQIFSYPIV